MNFNRRKFIKNIAVAGGLTAFSRSALGQGGTDTVAPTVGTDWVEAMRAQLPAVQQSAGYFQTGAFGPCPRQVIERAKELLDLQNLGPANPRYLNVLKEAEYSCRPLIAAALGADEGEVALTQSTTAGLNIVLWSIDWQAGDEIIIGDEEHSALLVPVYNLRDRLGVVVKVVPVMPADGLVDGVVERLSARTRLVAMSHVSRQSGTVVPASALAAALRPRGVPMLLDGAQGPGNVPVNFHEIGCDYYSLCGHKWLLGPKGTGALLIRKDRIPTTPVSWSGAHAEEAVSAEGGVTWHADARRYEFATRNQAGFGGWAESLRWLAELGWSRIHARVSALSAHASDRITQSARFELVSPSDSAHRNGIVVLRLPAAYRALDLYHRLREDDNMLTSPVTNPRDLRVCLHVYNTVEEFDAVLERLDHYCV
jgi:L-cysteine/cystine lyase